MSARRKRDESTQVVTRTRTRQATRRPPLYKVLFHNDDYTPMEFVVLLLIRIFHHSEAEATRIMLHVHNRGVGVAGVFPYSVAETKVAEVMAAAEKSEFPLLCTMEPAEDGDGDDRGDEPET